MQKYLAEFIGAFFLTLTFLLCSTHSGFAAFAPLATGSVLAAFLYAAAPVSGGHFNPGLTLASLMQGKLNLNDGITYMVVQTLGAMAAGAIAVYLHSASGEAAISPFSNNDPVGALLSEFLGAFAIAFVYLNTYTSERNAGNVLFGLATGLAYIAAAYSLGTVGGGVFNPALGAGSAVAGFLFFSDLWIYLLGGFAGAAAGVTAFRILESRTA